MEEVKSNSGQGMGVAALITAIITFVLAVIPCVGLIAIIPGVVAIILATVGMSQASRNNSPRGLLIAGLVIAIIATMISVSQIFVAGKIASSASNGKWPADIQNIINDVQNDVTKEIQDANISIKVESNGEKVEITTKGDKQELEQKLENLEGANDSDTVKNADTAKKQK